MKTSEQRMIRRQRAAYGVLLAVVAVLAVAAVEPLLLSQLRRDQIYEQEWSVVEIASVVAWILAAVSIPIILRSASIAVFAGIVLALTAAARESDMHGSLTGMSILKVRYYIDAANPIYQRALAGLVLVVIVICLCVVAVTLWRRAVSMGGLRRAWVQLVVLVMALLAGAKFLDSSPAILRSLGLELPLAMRDSMGAMEEHMELLVPLLVMMGLFVYARSGPDPRRGIDVHQRGSSPNA